MLSEAPLPLALFTLFLFRQLLILLFLLDFGGVLNLNSISDRYLVFQWYGFIVTQTGKEELNHEQASDPLLVRHFNLFIELKLVF